METTKGLNTRFWIESALAAISASLLAVTLIVPAWIEEVYGIDPDAGSGSLERTIVGAALAVTVLTVSLASREWRKRRPVTA